VIFGRENLLEKVPNCLTHFHVNMFSTWSKELMLCSNQQVHHLLQKGLFFVSILCHLKLTSSYVIKL